MNKPLWALALSASALFITGCNDDDDNNPSAVSAQGKTYLQAVHASSDAPLANVWVNGSPALEGVDYAQASGYVELDAGANSVQVDVQTGLGNVATVIEETSLDLAEDTRYTVLVTGFADSSKMFPVEPLIVTRPATGNADASNLDVQVIHAAAGVPDVDLYVTAPGADISASQPVGTLAYGAATGVLTIPGGDYQVRLAVSGTTDVAFDSGTISLPAGAELSIAAIPNLNKATGSKLVKLLVMDGTGSSVIHDVAELTQIRVGHLVNDAPVVDVALDGSEAVPNLAFQTVTGYVELGAAAYDVSVYPDDTPATLVIDAPQVAFDAAKDYSVYAVGELATIEPLVIEDNRRPVATSAVLNVVHAAPAAAAAEVDIYVTTTSDFTQSDPALTNFAYKDSVQQIYLPAGSYWVTVTIAGTQTAAIGPVQVTVENGMVYKAIAIELASDAGFDLLLEPITE